MAISFPGSPSTGQKFTSGNKVWTWDGNSWKGGVSSGGDAGTLDSLNSTQFLRSDADDTTTGNLSVGTTSTFTTGGTARLTLSASSVLLSAGASNSDMFYIRRQSAGNFAWQSYNSGNSGTIQLQPYGGNVGIGTDNPGAKLEVNGDALATSSFRIGDNSHWKIRGNNAYTDLAFEYATSSGLSDANIKITMKPNGDLVVGRNLYVNGDFITIPTSATDPSGAVAGSMYYNTSSQNLKVYNGTRWGLIPADTIFDIFGDGSIEAFYEFNNNLNDTGGVHNMSVSDFQTTDGSGYVTGKSGMAWKVGFEDWLLYRGIGLGNASSWSLWCKDLNSEGSNSILFGAGVWNSGSNGDLPGYGIFVDSSNNCYPYNKPGGTYNWTSTFTVSGWTHIAMTSGSNTIKTYVNGSLWNTKTSTTTATSINTLTAGRRLYHHDEDMAVTLDNVRIYNRVLTDAEVTQIYNLEN